MDSLIIRLLGSESSPTLSNLLYIEAQENNHSDSNIEFRKVEAAVGNIFIVIHSFITLYFVIYLYNERQPMIWCGPRCSNVGDRQQVQMDR